MSLEDILRRFGLDLPPPHEDFRALLRPLWDDPPKWLYMSSPPPHLLQGDVIGPIRFVAINEQNRVGFSESNVMVISNTCDLIPEQKPFALVAPLFELQMYTRPDYRTEQEWGATINAIRRFDTTWNYFLPHWTGLSESFVDFTRTIHIPTSHLHNEIREGRAAKILSLSQNGYFLFLMKLANFLLRRESREALRAND